MYTRKPTKSFVADGYGNRRVIVFDADTALTNVTGARTGISPTTVCRARERSTGPGPTQFNTVHGIRISNDGLVYVGDRVNNRIQVFTPEASL